MQAVLSRPWDVHFLRNGNAAVPRQLLYCKRIGPGLTDSRQRGMPQAVQHEIAREDVPPFLAMPWTAYLGVHVRQRCWQQGLPDESPELFSSDDSIVAVWKLQPNEPMIVARRLGEVLQDAAQGQKGWRDLF